MNPYSIACSTCGARLKVRDPKAIGELSLCPKCGSMVMVTPPTPGGASGAGVSPVAQRAASDSSQQIIVKRPASVASDFEDAAALFADTVDDLSPQRSGIGVRNSGTGVSPVTSAEAKSPVVKPTTNKQAKPSKDLPKKPALAANGADAVTGGTSVPLAAPNPPPLAPPTESMSSIELDPLAAPADSASPLAQAIGKPAQSFDLHPTPLASPQPLASLAGMPPPVVDDRPWASPTQQRLRRLALIGGAVAAAVVVVGVLLSIIFRHPAPPVVAATGEANEQPAPPDDDPPADPVAPPAIDEPKVDEPPELPSVESNDDDTMPPPEDIDDAPDDGDAPPIFVDSSEKPPIDPASEDPSGDEAADGGLGDFAPLIDAFPIPESPERDPADGDPAPAPADEPEVAPQRERPEPLAVDVAARLADPIDGIDTGGAPLVKFLELMSQLSTIPITLPPESLAQAQATATSPVSLVLRDANVDQVLQAGLAEHGLKYEIRGEELVVIPAPKRGAGLLTVSLAVEDLAPDAAALAALADQMRKFVAPELWDTAGGEAKIAASDGKLNITAAQGVQFDVHVFCQKLRVARGLPPRSKLNPALFALKSRSQQSAAKLAVPVRAIFHAERPLTRILNHLEQAAEVTLLVDWEALIAAGWPPHTTTTIVIDDQPLAVALDELLGPLDLTYRAIDENTVQITSRAALEARAELEFYSIAPQIDGGAAPEKLIADLTMKIGGGEIAFDDVSKCLLVRLPQTSQREAEASLHAGERGASAP